VVSNGRDRKNSERTKIRRGEDREEQCSRVLQTRKKKDSKSIASGGEQKEPGNFRTSTKLTIRTTPEKTTGTQKRRLKDVRLKK